MRTLACLSLAAWAAAAEPEAGVRVRPVWWQSPTQAIQLYAEGSDGKPHPVRVLQMCPLESFRADPAKGAVLLRQAEPDPADPKAKPRWIPYAAAPVPAGSSDLLMLLQPSADGASCQARVLPMDDASLRWGGTLLVNFTPAGLVGRVDGKPFAVAAGAATALPFVAAKRSVVDVLIATEGPRGRELVFSSKGIFSPSKRTVLFILRNAAGRHETRAIDEPNPDPKAYEDSEPGR